MSKLTTCSLSQPCEVCENTSPDCRRGHDISLCRTFADAKVGEIVNGHKMLKLSKDGMWGVFKLDNSQEWSDEQREKWQLDRERRKQHQKLKSDLRQKQSLSANERDKQYRKLFEELTLHPEDEKELVRRGLTHREIELAPYKSTDGYQKLREKYSNLLPGISPSGNVIMTDAGWLCPVRDKHGRIVSVQVRLRVIPTGGGRYRWLSSKTKTNPNGQSPHVYPQGANDGGELPLAIFYPEDREVAGIAIVEGTGVKPFFVAQRLGKLTIGAAGGQWASSPVTFKESLNEFSEKMNGLKELTIYPDAGDILNKSVMERWQRVVLLLQEWGWSIQFGWWGQVTKEYDDIDEIPAEKLKDISYIPPHVFFSLSKTQKKIPEDKLNQNKEKPNTEAWDIWRKARLFSPNLTINTKYFDTVIPEFGTFLAIKSGTGTGKTHWLINKLIEAYSDYGFLSVGYRNSPLIQFSLDEKLKENWYHLQKDLRNTKELILIADPRSKILCCLDSLIHFRPEDFDNKILILDEIESIVYHLFKANTTIGLFRERIKELFIDALNYSSMIIIMDGHLNDTTVEYLQGLISNPKKLVKIENLYQGNKGHVNLLEGIESDGKIKIDNYSPITEAIKNNLECFAVASDSQCQLEAIDNILVKQGRKTLRLDSTTSNQKWVEAFLEKPEQYLRDNKIEVILYSPSGDAGLNIDIKGYFSDIYLLFFGVITTNSQLQMIARIRDPQSQIHIYCKNRGLPSNSIHKSCIPEKLEESIIKYVNECGLASFKGLSEQGSSDEERIIQLVQQLIVFSRNAHYKHETRLMALENHERRNLRACLKEALIQSGYKVESVIGQKYSTKEVRQKSQEVKVAKSEMIANAAEICGSEVQKITSTISATLEQKAMVNKYRLMERLPGIVQATYNIAVPVASEVSLTIEPIAEIKPEDPEGNSVDISAPQALTQQDESPPALQQIEKPIFTSEFVKKVLFDNKALISQVETRWLLDNPIVAKELQQIKWHKKLAIFTNPDELDTSKRLNLTTYKSLWLKILRLREMGIDNFLKPGAEWNGNSKDVLDFWNKGKRNAKAIGVEVGNSTPCEYLGRVLTSLGLQTQSKQINKVRFYQITKPDHINLAIYQAVGQRLEAELLEKKSSVNWNLILSAETQSVEGLHPAHLPQDFYNKNQQGVLKLEEKTFLEVSKDLTTQPAMPVMDYAGVVVKEPISPAPHTTPPSIKVQLGGVQAENPVQQAFSLEEVMTPESLRDIANDLEDVAKAEGSEAVEMAVVMLQDIRAWMPPEALKAAANLLPKPLRSRLAEMVRAMNTPVEIKPISESKPDAVTPHLPQVTKTDKPPAPPLSKEDEAFAEWSQLHNLIRIANEFLAPLAKLLPDQAIKKIKHILTFIPSKAVSLAAGILTGDTRDVIGQLLLGFNIAID